MTLNWQADREYMSIVEEIMNLEEVKGLEKYVHHRFTNRLAHSISVSYRSFRWARRLGLNRRSIARAGLLHDLFFYESHEKSTVGGKGHNYEHPRIALANAIKLVELSDMEQDIILKHMFGATLDLPRYAESWVVTLMDKEAAISELYHGYLSVFVNEWRQAADTYRSLIKPAFRFSNSLK
ncbi:HD domain-containing protein [Ignavigranum ruoffiae]|uniref:HD domain-containing protein n=1 Tax=Ignavigranum ruoffiae TaxID=89093 RepID=A0A1H9A3T4_9LACT|nr:HD domain-containing protein [Ignavigranum ruoffiae]UPQ85723.1 HD domain-containing protein [Ignavigranum ruoffiae]SEP71171.1 uncharacterized protein SAMN04488558_101408 [Ignavigranum ruoffiae]